jgi:Domain of unknown function (DUF4168)
MQHTRGRIAILQSDKKRSLEHLVNWTHSFAQVMQHGLRRLAALMLTLVLVLGLAFSQGTAANAAQGGESAPLLDLEAEPLPAPRSSVDANDISLEKVAQFVRAYLNVLTLIEGREGELQGAETDLESVRIEQEIESEAFSLIEAEGLTMQEYLQLLRLANTDPDFGERIAAQLQEALD